MDFKKILEIIGFGFIVWLIPTIVTYFASDAGSVQLYDFTASVAIGGSAVVLSYIYFKDITSHFVREGVILAIVWVLITIVLDVVLIYLGISKTSLLEYAVTVVPLYVIIPAITIGFGLYLDQMVANVSIYEG
ncbi:MAG: hypothetical protein A4E26_02246 [Methanobacterium sp. PtaU1.Bin097]|jgi:uncharacterized membrane-anchored protein|nr:MAG: hypothetical protein A4E26_02246 [Methanobacterium sp. PtaU1.Bin097]